MIVQNLITNSSLAFDGLGGLIKVSTKYDSVNETVQIRVKDNGHGIPQKDLDQVFTPFFTTRRQKKGRGLGLTIVRHFVLSIGGVIDIKRARIAPGPGVVEG